MFWTKEYLDSEQEYWDTYWRATIEGFTSKNFELRIYTDSEKDLSAIEKTHSTFDRLIEKDKVFRHQMIKNILDDTALFFEKKDKTNLIKVEEQKLFIHQISIFQDLSSKIIFIEPREKPPKTYFSLIDNQLRLVMVGISDN